MEFMSYAFEGSGVEVAADTFTGSGRLVNERNLKSFSEIDQSVSRPNHESNEFMELGLGDPCLRVSSCEIDNDFAEMGRINPGDMEVEGWVPRDAISCHNWKTSSEELASYRHMKSGQSLPEKAAESGIPVLQVYDPNKGLVDCKKVKSGQHSKQNLDLSSAATVKRARITNFSSQPPLCQVHGCFRDLSSSKDYYRRHRVCNEHSKTTKVIVDGIEQRFCQQCSRFHLLSEFDDDKRSCRKSLAGHNERRRKPQFDTHHGPRLFDMSLQTEAFFLPELLPVNYFCQERYELENSSKLDEKHISFSKLLLPKSKGSKDLSSLHFMQKQDQSKNHLATAENSSCGHSDWDFGRASGLRTLRCFTSNEMEGSSDVVDGNAGVYYDAEIDENLKSAESGTIDLEQLSTHLQRVEHQRNSAQLKLGSNLFYC